LRNDGKRCPETEKRTIERVELSIPLILKEAHFEADLPSSNSVRVELTELTVICARTRPKSSFENRIGKTVKNEAPFGGKTHAPTSTQILPIPSITM
jgi:hypothetical protein